MTAAPRVSKLPTRMRRLSGIFVVFSLSLALTLFADEPITNSIGMTLVPVPAGEFLMGQDGPAADYHMVKHPAKFDDADWDEKPAHPVRITQRFHLGTTEVTLEQYRHFKPNHRASRGGNEAATGVSWDEAVAFCAWLSEKEGLPYRLPTEAEWEYACRAGTTTLFNTGDSLPPSSHLWFREENGRLNYFTDGIMPAEYLHLEGIPVLTVARGEANAFGLFDMHGNVYEWSADWYGPYEAGETIDPTGRIDGDFRVFRGGSHSSFTRLLRSANRGAWIPESKHESIGFRVALGAKPSATPLPLTEPPLHARNVSQVAAVNTKSPSTEPFFDGPRVYVKMPTDAAGPLYAWHNHSPAITECPNGDLLASWFSCVDEGGSELNNLASRLRSGGTEWETASVFWDGADVNDHAPKLWWDGDKTIFHFARGHSENIVRTSTNSGATWSKARLIFPHGEFGNQLLRTRDGARHLTHDSRTTSLVSSHDAGATWQAILMSKRDDVALIVPGGIGHRPPGIHAPIVELADGSLMAVSRQDPVEDRARFHGKTPISISRDGGKTWTFAESPFPAISSAQRAVMLRLAGGPILICSFTDLGKEWKDRKGLTFTAADGSEFQGYGLFAALSYDEGKTWPTRRLITPGAEKREQPTIDRGIATFSETMSEPTGYLAITQTHDERIHLLSSKNHYVFNQAWLEAKPPKP
jgi:formylglycine-generating enzyme